MKQLIPKREWKILNFELFENKPLNGPFPEDVVKRSELLLIAQCVLSDFELAKSRKDKEFFGELYQKIMELYFTWKIE
jgi:hypothetical protein